MRHFNHMDGTLSRTRIHTFADKFKHYRSCTQHALSHIHTSTRTLTHARTLTHTRTLTHARFLLQFIHRNSDLPNPLRVHFLSNVDGTDCRYEAAFPLWLDTHSHTLLSSCCFIAKSYSHSIFYVYSSFFSLSFLLPSLHLSTNPPSSFP